MAKRGGKLDAAALARQARTKELNKQYRANAAKLKKLGLLSDKVNARANIKRGTRTKINSLRDVLEGRAKVVKLSPPEALLYKQSGVLRVVGRRTQERAVVPIDFPETVVKKSRGFVQTIRPLKNGQEEQIILPWRVKDLFDLVEKLQSDPDALDRLKLADEYLSFRLFEHNAGAVFEDADALRAYLDHYLSRLGSNKEAIKNLTFQRFKARPTEMFRSPFESDKPKTPYNSNTDVRNGKRAKGTYELQRDAARAKRKEKLRAAETPEQRKKRLDYQKIYQARYRQRKFEES